MGTGQLLIQTHCCILIPGVINKMGRSNSISAEEERSRTGQGSTGVDIEVPSAAAMYSQ